MILVRGFAVGEDENGTNIFGVAFLVFFRSFARSAAGRLIEDPCDEEDSSRVNVAMYDATAEESVVNGMSVCTLESHDRIEYRAPVRTPMSVATSLRTPSIRGFSPSQSSAPIEPVRSMTK